MQSKRAAELRKKWGNKPCAHPKWSKEYYLGAQTEDMVCTQCGYIASKEEYQSLKGGKRSPEYSKD